MNIDSNQLLRIAIEGFRWPEGESQAEVIRETI